jgi:hypothetical protein
MAGEIEQDLQHGEWKSLSYDVIIVSGVAETI